MCPLFRPIVIIINVLYKVHVIKKNIVRKVESRIKFGNVYAIPNVIRAKTTGVNRLNPIMFVKKKRFDFVLANRVLLIYVNLMKPLIGKKEFF